MKRPRLLDLFSGAGGAAKGYQRAGFYVVGVDIKPQPRYCGDEFYQADALDVLREMVEEGAGRFTLAGTGWLHSRQKFDAIHASPPCQAYSLMTKSWGRQAEHPDLVAPVRDYLKRTTLPWVIENVVGAPLIEPIQLCGSSFGLRVRRHRLFESNLTLWSKPCSHHWQDSTPIFNIRNHGAKLSGIAYVFGHGTGKANEHWGPSMGIDWMTRHEMAESIPPAYTEYIGKQLMAVLSPDSIKKGA